MAMDVERILKSTRKWSDRRPLNGEENERRRKGKRLYFLFANKIGLPSRQAKGVNLFGSTEPLIWFSVSKPPNHQQ